MCSAAKRGKHFVAHAGRHFAAGAQHVAMATGRCDALERLPAATLRRGLKQVGHGIQVAFDALARRAVNLHCPRQVDHVIHVEKVRAALRHVLEQCARVAADMQFDETAGVVNGAADPLLAGKRKLAVKLRRDERRRGIAGPDHRRAGPELDQAEINHHVRQEIQ